MSNLHPPDFEPELSDIRTRGSAGTRTGGGTGTSSTSSSSLIRRSEGRVNRLRRQEAHRSSHSPPNRSSGARIRQLANFMRSGYQGQFSPSPPAPNVEPANKRRRMERTGQVEMEQLPMELRYCDGGRYDDGRFYSTQFSPECALRDDSTVYCTGNPRCNMILRHVDGQCFSLQKLVIRAPPAGYTSPVRAGMIFVTMEETDLLSRTDYTVHYESDDEENNESSDEDGAIDFRLLDSDCEPGQEDTEPTDRYTPILHRGLGASAGASRIRPRTSIGPSSSTSASWDDHISRPPPVELLEPNATFNHKDRRTKCVINFEPAISGRYIVAKFFSTPRQRNIDIEFVGAYGWTGRRFFPSVTMR
ncbi:hypothetical protein EDC01DRAFT_657865 [Geopyxis carbonaria]|nr:hypothetical protein EDC01DRAFT_657865 [Geopyxis carbonaria]